MTRARFILLAVLAFGGCTESDIDPMMSQEKYKAYRENPFYPDERAMRVPPAHTVAREHVVDDTAAPPVTQELLERGRDRFNIYCAVCHGTAGDGDSVVGSKMSLRPPPSFHDDRLRAYTSAQLYETITNGYGYMPRYDAELSVRDRWAIANYVKALQLSQHAPLSAVPADKRGDLDKPAQPASEHSENKE